jgi:hypothetical protein
MTLLCGLLLSCVLYSLACDTNSLCTSDYDCAQLCQALGGNHCDDIYDREEIEVQP